MPQPLFTPGKDPVPIVQEAGWAPGPVWTGVENLAPTRIYVNGIVGTLTFLFLIILNNFTKIRCKMRRKITHVI